jgi:acetyltransferase-like isoleucine patch superfamily enzyme
MLKGKGSEQMQKRLLNLARKVLGLGPSASESWTRFAEYLEIHPTVIIGKGATLLIDELPKNPRIMVKIGEGSHIFGRLSLINEEAEIVIGRNCQIGSSDLIASKKITIGDDVIMSWGCTLLDSDNHSIFWKYRKEDVAIARKSHFETDGERITKGHNWESVERIPIEIGHKTYVGMNSVVLKGVKIGEECVIGANTVVRKSVPAKTISIGNPSFIIGKITE